MRLDAITVGERRRDDLGDIDALMRSIERWGLIQPVVVDAAGALVAGGRRLEALRRLGWAEIPTRDYGSLTEDERQELELEENTMRKALTVAERSKDMRRRAAVAFTVLTRRAHELSDRSEPVPSADRGISSCTVQEEIPRGRGRPPGRVLPVTKIDVAESLGVNQATVWRAEQHAAVVERHPDLEPLPMQTALKEAARREGPPKEPRRSPRKRADGGPAVAWVRQFRRLEDLTATLSAAGGLVPVVAEWPAADLAGLSRELRELAATFEAWATALALVAQASLAEGA